VPRRQLEIDLFSSVCRIAIDSWRIHTEKSPMDSLHRPRYYNERDRRLKGDEEERLRGGPGQSINVRLERLMSEEPREANAATTLYGRKQVSF
jgi:hypothetical protein